jgi:transcriptional accessory protein Tex/SPT6
MGPKVFINCSGFIKIDSKSLGDSRGDCAEFLDGFRVHPESHELAADVLGCGIDNQDEAITYIYSRRIVKQ